MIFKTFMNEQLIFNNLSDVSHEIQTFMNG
jgi:hypothetical protein